MNALTIYAPQHRTALLSPWPLIICMVVPLPYSFWSTALILPYSLLVTATLLFVWVRGRALTHIRPVQGNFSYNRIFVLMAVYTLYQCLTPWLHETTMTGFPANKYIVLALAYLIVYLLALFLFRSDDKTFRKFCLWTTVLAIALALQFYYIILFAGKSYDGQGLMLGRHLLAMLLVLAVYLLLQSALFGKWTSWIIVGLLLATAMLCASRTVVLALFMSASAVVVLYRRQWLRMRYLIPAIGLFLIAGIGLYLIQPESMDGRLLLWKIGLSALDAENLVLGRGAGFMECHLADLQGAALQEAALSDRLLAGDVRTVLNEYIRLLVEHGIIGGLVVLTLVVWTLWTFIRSRHYMLVGALLFLLVCAMSSYPLLSTPIHLIVIILLAYATVLSDRYKKSAPVGRYGRIVRYGAVGIVLLFVLAAGAVAGRYGLALYQWHTKSRTILIHYNEPLFYQEYTGLERILGGEPAFVSDYANRLLALADTEAAVALLEKAVALQPTAERYMQLGQGYEQLSSVAEAAGAYEKAVHILPKSFLPKFLLFDLYRQHDDRLLARRWAEEITRHPVKVPSEQVQGIRQEAENYLKTTNTN